MELLSYAQQDGAVILKTTRGQIKIEAIQDDILHVVYTLEPVFSAKASLMTVQSNIANAALSVSEDTQSITLYTESLRLTVDRLTCAFAYADRHGRIIAREPAKGGKELTPIDVMRPVHDDNGKAEGYIGVDGPVASTGHTRKERARTAYSTKLRFCWKEGEALFGLGSHEEGVMNLRGTMQYLYQHPLKAVVPMLLSSEGYGVLFDSYSMMIFRDDMYGSYIWSDTDDELEYYFIYGPEPDRVISRYRTLTGTAPLPPKWAFGYIQSKERYKSQEELLEVVRSYRQRNIPLDAVVLDWLSWEGDLWGQKSLDRERFPDPQALTDQLHEMGVHLMVSIWPKMSEGGSNYAEMKEGGFILDRHMTYNAFNAGARALYWRQANEGLFSKGVDAWWCDCTEPFESDWSGAVRPEPEFRMIGAADAYKEHIDPEYLNAYSLLHSNGIYAGQRSTTDRKRVLNLTRSSYAGQHRYGTVTWSGDIAASWETYKRQIAGGLNFCAAGEPYWTLDIGAFFTGGEKSWSLWNRREGVPAPWFLSGDYDGGTDDLGYCELYVRWFQYGAFLPMFRAHGTQCPREIWRFQKEGQPFYETLVRFNQLRYRLMPYIYAVAGMVTRRGYTMMRALVFDFREDPKVLNIDDQYMFGPALMVCPVVKPMYYDSDSRPVENADRTRRVYLPEGCSWYDFWTGEQHAGGQAIQAAAPLDIMPLYARAGSIVPMGPVIQHTGEHPGAALEIRIYPGADSVFELYEDEADGYDYEKGACSIIRFQWHEHDKTLVIARRQGEYPGMPIQREFVVVLVGHGQGIGVGESAGVRVRYDGTKTTLSRKAAGN